MTELDYQLQKLQQDPNTIVVNTPEPTPMEKLLNTRESKLNTLATNRAAKELKLRKDPTVYEEDSGFVQGAKELINTVLPHDYQIGVNKFGGQYNTANKTFNEDDLTGIWDKYEDDPAGNKSLYYLRKQDPYTGKYVYKPGIADVSAAERYLTQEKADGWELLGEKRFNEASEVEKQIHGNKKFLESRVFDRGTTVEGGADNFFGAGSSELYNRDILGLDTGTAEDYRKLQDKSYDKMLGLIPNDKQREDTFEFIDALQAGGITLGAQVIKLIGEAVSSSDGDGVIEAFGKKLAKDANKIAGYNPVASAEAMKGLEDSFNRGDYVNYAFNMAKGAPQWLAQSLPNMAAFAAVSSGTTAATGGNVMAGLAAGSAFMGAIRANDVLDNREKITGRKATVDEVATIYGVSSILSLLEYGALKYAFTGKGMMIKDPAGNSKNIGKELFKNKTKLGETAIWLGDRAKGSAAEGGEEVISGLTEFLMENYGTEKYMGQSITDLLTSDTARTTAIQSFGAGAGAGGLASTLGSGVKDIDKTILSSKIESISKEAQGFNEAQKEYRDSLIKEQGISPEEFVPTDKQKEVFDSLGDVATENPTVQDVVDKIAAGETELTVEEQKIQDDNKDEVETKLKELTTIDTTQNTLVTINEEIAALEAERKTISSKDSDALTQLDLKLNDLETKKDNVKAKMLDDLDQYNLEATAAKMKKDGATDEEIQEANDKLAENLVRMRGVSEGMLTAKDKADGLTIEVANPTNGIRLSNTNSKKSKTFQGYDVKDETIKEIVSGGFTEETAKKLLGKVQTSKISESLVKHFRAESPVVAELKSIQKSISKTLSTPEGKAKLGNLITEGTENVDEKVMRMVTLALSQVKSNITSEYHVNKNAGLKGDAQHARVSDITQQLGKDYLNSYDIKYAGKAAPLARKNSEIGQQILDFAEEAGLIEQLDARVSAINLVNSKGENINSSAMNESGLDMSGSEVNVNGKSVPMVKTKVVKLIDNKSKGNGYVDSAKAYASNVMARILKPTNQEVPGTQAVEEVPSDTDNLSETHQGIIRNMNSWRFEVAPEALELYKEIRELTYGKDGSGDFDKAVKTPEVKELLGLLGVKADVNKESDSGRSLNKTDNLRGIIDNLDVLDPTNMYYNYESAINQRIHSMQTVLEPQGDKYMARNVVTGGQYTTETKLGRQMIVDSVEEALGKDTDIYSKKLDTAVDTLNKNGRLKLKYLLRLDKKLGIGNPFKTLTLMKAVRDIRNAKKDGPITTNYMVEFDASASGVTNTMLNRAGDTEVQEILQKMTIMGGTMDPYTIVNETVRALESNPDFDTEVQPILDKFATIFGNSSEQLAKAMRQIAKYPVMTWFYGSSETNVAKKMAEDMTAEVVERAINGNKEAVDIINELAGTNYMGGKSISILDKHKHYINKANKLFDVVNSGEDYVVLDTETTGTGSDADVIQIAIITMNSGKEVSRYSKYLPTDKDIEKEASEVTGIDNKELNKRLEKQSNTDRISVLQEVAKIIGTKPIIAHNAEFDVVRIKRNMAVSKVKNTISKDNSHDTLSVARVTEYNELISKSKREGTDIEYVSGVVKLENLGKKYGVKTEGSHDALWDTQQTVELIPILEKRFNSRVSNMSTNGKDVVNLSDEDILAMKKYYADNVGSVYASSMAEIFPGVTAYRNDMNALYKILKATGKWEGMLPTAMAALEGKPTENKMSIRKRKQTIDNGTIFSDMFDNANSIAVNPQHAVDAALLLKAIEAVMKKHPEMQGILTVHDATYGNPKIILEVKAEYDRLSAEVAVKYDFVAAAISEAREAIAKVEDKAEQKSFTLQVDAIEAKNKKLQEAKAAFLKDKKISVLEGAKPINTKAEPEVKEDVKSEPKVEEKPKPKPTKKIAIIRKLQSAVKQIREGGSFEPLIDLISELQVSKVNEKVKDKVLEALTGGKIGVDAAKMFAALPGEIFVSSNTKDMRFKPYKNFTHDGLIETLGHEVDHAYNWSYLSDAKNKDKAEVKYMTKVLHKILSMNTKGLSIDAVSRIQYIKDEHKDRGLDSALAETISILNNEGDVAAEILQVLPKSALQKTLDIVKELIQNISDYILGKSREELRTMLDSDTGIRTDNVIIALKILEDVTMSQTEEQITSLDTTDKRGVSKNSKQYDVHRDAYLNPYKYADGIISKSNSYTAAVMRIFGNTVLDAVSPAIGEAHTKAKRKSAIYRDTVNLIRTGFIDSEIAQKMKSTLGVERHINNKVMQELLHLGDKINQETKTILTTDLSRLSLKLQKLYPDVKDQTTIYKIFARTGISGIQYNSEVIEGISSGNMTIDEAIKITSKGVDDSRITKIKELAKYYTDGTTNTMYTNTEAAELYKDNDKVLVALYALKNIDSSQDMLSNMNENLRREMLQLAVSVQSLSDEINMREPGFDGIVHTNNAMYATDFDGHYTMDVYEKKYEYKLVSSNDMKSSKYTSENDWIVVKEVNSDGIGLVARSRIGDSITPGVGVNVNKFNNGFYMSEEDSVAMSNKLASMSEKNSKAFLLRNNIVRSDNGKRYRFALDEKTKVDKLGMKQNAAESLLRTYAHNMELVQMQSVRDVILNSATAKLNESGMKKLNDDIMYNNNRGRKEDAKVMPMFITIDYKYDSYDSLPKWVKNEYKTPTNLSTYNGFNTKVHLVRKGEADILLGHKNFSLFGGTDYRTAAKFEQAFKEIVVMAKQKMVVANAGKLAVDIVSNMGILTAKDVSIFEMKKYVPEAFKEYTDFSRKRTEIVNLELQARMGDRQAKVKLDKAKKALENHKFYESFKYGFVQSYSTSLVTQDFDTLSGLQHDIDAIIEGITKDKKGSPNEIYNAIKWWQKLGDSKGIGVDHLIKWASEVSKVKGTYIGDEMANMAKRLRDKKDVDSVARYVGDIIGSPASELVTLGGAVMVSADAISKYTLAQSLLNRSNPKTKEMYTLEDAYIEANETFIDYRQNLPAEIKALSDYGVLLFPSFWIKAQKVIAGLVTYHPFTAVGGYAIADALDINSANFIDVNIINRVMDGRITNDPTNLVDWDILSPWL